MRQFYPYLGYCGLALALGSGLFKLSQSLATPKASQSEPIDAVVAPPRYPTATLLSVGDGDTVTIQQAGQRISVRLACIDAPETTQSPWGPAATLHLEQLLPVGSTLQVRAVTTDRYGRLVAELYQLNGRSINLWQVASGHALVYRQYLDACAPTQQQYLTAEAQAKQQQLGVWHGPSALTIAPWAYRQQTRLPQSDTTRSAPLAQSPQTSPASPPATPPAPATPSATRPSSGNCDPSYPTVCIPPAPPALNCKDVPYRRFRVVGRDPHGFDRDRDGIGCES